MAPFDDYAQAYQTIRMERRQGILQIIFHTNSGPLQWGEPPHREFGQAFRDIGSDTENKVVIMTGTGEAFSGPRATWTGACGALPAIGTGPIGKASNSSEPVGYRGADDQCHQRPGLTPFRNPAIVRYCPGH